MGDFPGHPFRGNQYGQGAAEKAGYKSAARNLDPAERLREGDREVASIHEGIQRALEAHKNDKERRAYLGAVGEAQKAADLHGEPAHIFAGPRAQYHVRFGEGPHPQPEFRKIETVHPHTSFDVHEGTPSWHQARAGAISAAVTSGFKTRADAEAHVARMRVHHPEIPTFIVGRK